MPNHTPGNWRPQLHVNSRTWGVETDYGRKTGHPDHAVAYMLPAGTHAVRDTEEEEANAVIMAAAPRMYQALSILRGYLAELHEEPCTVRAEHGVEFKRYEKEGRVWYAHKAGQKWCREKS